MEAQEIGGTGRHLSPGNNTEHIPGLDPASAKQFLFRGGQHLLRAQGVLPLNRLYPPEKIQAIAHRGIVTKSVNS